MQLPTWITTGNLGTYSNSYNFNTDNLVLTYDASYVATVKLLNGSIPSGLVADITPGQITITGQSTQTHSSNNEFTYRITDQGMIADRTFQLQLVSASPVPDWSKQPTFLGYAYSNQHDAQFQVTAEVTGTLPITYALLPVVTNSALPTGMSINSKSGVINYSPGVVFYDQLVTVIVSATSGNSVSNTEVSIQLLSVPHAPVWSTPSGNLTTIQRSRFIQLQLEAFGPGVVNSRAQASVHYFISSGALPPGLSLTSSGLIYGYTPTVYGETVYNFSVTASNNVGSATEYFSITVVVGDISAIFAWNSSTTDFGTVTDGNIYVFDAGAASARTRLINYSLTGGILPMNMTLDPIQGKIYGYVEFHVRDRDYVFEITASDGVDRLTRQYRIAVVQRAYDQYLTVSIPLSGSNLKNLWAGDIGAIMDTRIMIPNSDVIPGIVNYPELTLISGLSYANQNIDDLYNNIKYTLKPITVSMGQVSNSVVIHNQSSIYREIADPQSLGMDNVVIDGNTVSISSLHNWRNSISKFLPYVSSGLGTAARLSPLISAGDGTITSVYVVETGYGYYYPPQLTVQGTGTGAACTCDLKVVAYQNIVSEQGWVVGDTVSITFGRYTRAAVLKVSKVDNIGNIIALEILDGGAYTQFPQGSKTIIRNNTGYTCLVQLQLGINTVTVTTAGSGYAVDNTTVDALGREFLPNWTSSWIPYLPIATIGSSSLSTFAENNIYNNTHDLDGQLWPINSAIIDLQGRTWLGDTEFDCSFDNDSTHLSDSREPMETVFDQNQLVFDHTNTTFDTQVHAALTVYDAWSTVVVDHTVPIVDMNQTIFDLASPALYSQTRLRRIITF